MLGADVSKIVQSLLRAVALSAAGMFVVCASMNADAADVSIPPSKPLATPAPLANQWTYTLSAYSWLTSLNGTTTVANQTKDIDVTFVDLLKQAQIPKTLFETSVFAEARNGRFSLFSDLNYEMLQVSKSGARSRTLTIGGVPVAVASGSVSASVKVQMFIATLAASYEVARWQSPIGMPGATAAFDLYAGARIWWQQADLDLGAAAGIAGLGPLNLAVSGGRIVATSGDVSWVDPLVGARLRYQFAPGRVLTISGDIGGFDVGSRFSWQAVGAYNFDLLKTPYGIWSGMIGYKALYADYSQGSGVRYYNYDLVQHGPIMGLTLRF